ncbi:chromatin associated protein [Mycena olivaceomarginata]|nr:chromatin associated protein [Mycena olivaceomarginata]
MQIDDALNAVKHEYDVAAAELVQARAVRDEYEAKVTSQINELNIIRQALYGLEAQHEKVCQRHEDEIQRLRAELHTLRQSSGSDASGSKLCRSSNRFSGRVRERRDRGERDHKGRDSKPPALSRHDPPTRPIDGPQTDSHQDGPSPSDHKPTFPSFLDNRDPSLIPADLKTEGSDWFAVFNPGVRPRALGHVSLVHTLRHATVVCSVQFSTDGRYLATGCNHGAQIYDVKTGLRICVLVDDSSITSGDLYIRSVRFSPDGRYLATGAEDRQVRIWDIAEQRICNVFQGHTQGIYSLSFSRDRRQIVSGSGDRTVRIWNLKTCACVVLSVDGDSAAGTGVVAGDPKADDTEKGDAGVTSVAISPDGQYVVAGSLDAIVRIWNVVTGTLVDSLRGHRDSVYSVVFTPDGKGVVSGSLDKTLKYWDLTALLARPMNPLEDGESACGKDDNAAEKVGPCTNNFTGHKDYVLSVAVSHDGQWIVSGSRDRGVLFWDRGGVVQSILQGHKNSVISIDLSPMENLLVTGSGDNLARIWSYNTA